MSIKKEGVLLLIGGSGGIGRALIQSDLFQFGIKCIPTYFSNKPVNDNFAWYRYDSKDLSGVEEILKNLSNEYNIDMILDASGAFFASTLAKTSFKTIEDVAWTNFLAPLSLAKIAQEYLAPSGKLVFLSSVTTQLNIYGSSVYAASKSGLEKSISILGPEYQKKGLAICGIRLGYMDYGMTHQINDLMKERVKKSLPGEKFTDIQVLVDLLLKIAGSDSLSVTGNIYDLSHD